MDASLSLVISFAGFVWLFWKKIYPFVIYQLDKYIEGVKSKIRNAEQSKEKASIALRDAQEKRCEVAITMEKDKKESQERLQRLGKENERQLEEIRKKFGISLQKRLDQETEKKKDELLNRLSDQIVAQVSARLSTWEANKFEEFTQEDLQKLV
ncbi:MAG: hypothetical protein LBS14_01815 [Holosporaceae bacterium]|jgi:F0F1-type ATP synthase membrane subunit b/b'|nr:hypothetical protein [Holosporaceae bacterium]